MEGQVRLLLISVALLTGGCTQVEVFIGGDVSVDIDAPLPALMPPPRKVFREGFYQT